MAQLKLFSISELVNRLSKVADENRYDQVARNVHAIFEARMQNSPEGIVSSADLKKVYSTFAGMDTQSKFRDYFEDIFKEETAAAENGLVFSRDNSFSEEFRPTTLEYTPNIDDQIKAASLTEIQKVISGTVVNPQYRYQGFTNVANVGGFANWTVAFETGHGVAEIAVPVIVTEEAAHAPNQFSSGEGTHAFNKETLANFARAYSGARLRAASKSGLEYLGTQSLIPIEQFVTDINTDEPIEVTAGGGSTPIDERLTATVDGMQKSTFDAIERARVAATNKLTKDSAGNAVPNNVQIAYAGSVRFEDMPNDEENFNGVVAFNASRKTRFGTRTITIPVEIRGNVHVADVFVDQSQVSHNLNATAVDVALGENGTEADAADAEAFGDAFLASMASYKQLCDEMKASIYNGNLKRASAVIKAIANRFDDAVVKNAMDDYLEYVKDAASKKTAKKVTDWHTEIDDHYTGSIKSSSIVLN